MITVQVTYTVKADFVEENINNINIFITDFKTMLASKFLYHVCMKDDGLTFEHIAMFENEEIQKEVLSTPSFVSFQQQRDEKGLVAAPVIEVLKHVGSSISLIK